MVVVVAVAVGWNMRGGEHDDDGDDERQPYGCIRRVGKGAVVVVLVVAAVVVVVIVLVVAASDVTGTIRLPTKSGSIVVTERDRNGAITWWKA